MAYHRKSSRSSGDDTDYGGLCLLLIFLAAMVIAVVAWLAQQCIWLGPVVMLGALILYLLIKDTYENAALLCFGIFFDGLVIFLFGITTTHFFQTDPTGKELINFSSSVINTSQQFYKGATGM